MVDGKQDGRYIVEIGTFLSQSTTYTKKDLIEFEEKIVLMEDG